MVVFLPLTCKIDLIYFVFHVRYECMFVFLFRVFSDPNIAIYVV